MISVGMIVVSLNGESCVGVTTADVAGMVKAAPGHITIVLGSAKDANAQASTAARRSSSSDGPEDTGEAAAPAPATARAGVDTAATRRSGRSGRHQAAQSPAPRAAGDAPGRTSATPTAASPAVAPGVESDPTSATSPTGVATAAVAEGSRVGRRTVAVVRMGVHRFGGCSFHNAHTHTHAPRGVRVRQRKRNRPLERHSRNIVRVSPISL